MKTWLRAVPWLVLSLTIAGTAWGSIEATSRPNVVMILVDTLRPDHLDVYGARRVTAPFLRSLGERSVVFERAYANATWTRAALPTILTSHSPLRHGKVMGGAGQAETERFVERLDDAFVTLPEVLQDAGYETAAVVTWHGGAGFYSDEFGLRQGFDYVNHPSTVETEAPHHLVGLRDIDEAIVAHALDWVAGKRQHGRPFFLWVHLFGVHGPFEPPSAYESLFAPPDLVRAMRAKYGNSYGVPYDVAARGGLELDYVRAQYDGSVRFVDDLLAKLVQGVETAAVGTVFVVFADHGEAFFEQPGQYKHGDGNFPYDPVSRIPLIVYAPGRFSAARRHELVSQLDLLPTVAELADAVRPAGVEGTSLVPLLRGDGRAGTAVVPVQSGMFVIAAAAVAEGKKYLYLNPHNVLDTARHLEAFEQLGEGVYDLRADPDERFNVLFYEDDFARRMRAWTEQTQLARMFGWHLVYTGQAQRTLVRGEVRADVPLYRMNIRYVGSEPIDMTQAFAASVLREDAAARALDSKMARGERQELRCPGTRRAGLRYDVSIPPEWAGRVIVFGVWVEPVVSGTVVRLRIEGADRRVLRRADVAGRAPGAGQWLWNRLVARAAEPRLSYVLSCAGSPRRGVRVMKPFLALEPLQVSYVDAADRRAFRFEGALDSGRLAVNFATEGAPAHLALELDVDGRPVGPGRLLVFDGTGFGPADGMALDARGVEQARLPMDADPAGTFESAGRFYLYRADPGHSQTEAISPGAVEMLRALGYLGDR